MVPFGVLFTDKYKMFPDYDYRLKIALSEYWIYRLVEKLKRWWMR